MVRDNPNKLPQVREYYRKCSWELAMHMRSSGSFAEGVQQIISSPEKHDALARWMPPDGKGKGKGKEGKGKEGKGKQGGKTARFLTRANTPYERPQCRLFQQGFLQVRGGVQVRPRQPEPEPAGHPLGTARNVR